MSREELYAENRELRRIIKQKQALIDAMTMAHTVENNALMLTANQASEQLLKLQKRVHKLEADNRSLVQQMNAMAMKIEHKSGTAERRTQ